MTAKKKDDAEAPYKDVSDQVDASAPDDDGNVDDKAAAAAAEVHGELSHRAAGAGEGGGPWPEEVMRKRFLQTQETGVATPEDGE